jgi:hypothetical protein
MEANPRSMKRLVNAYNIWMVKSLISEKEVESSDLLARWVIITLRWPYLIDYLEKHSELIHSFNEIEQTIQKEKIEEMNFYQKIKFLLYMGN